MTQRLELAALVAALALALPTTGCDDKKDAKADAKKDDAKKTDVKAGEAKTDAKAGEEKADAKEEKEEGGW